MDIADPTFFSGGWAPATGNWMPGPPVSTVVNIQTPISGCPVNQLTLDNQSAGPGNAILTIQ
jgi:hypothetical protein